MSQRELFVSPFAYVPLMSQLCHPVSVTDGDWRRLQADAARARGELGALRAVTHADRVDRSWRAAALESVRLFATEHESFLAEDVHAGAQDPDGVDGRAWGAVMQAARRRGWIEPRGYAPANSSNRSPKVLWASKLHVQASAPLERMVSDSAQAELFPGTLRVDQRTGEILDYDALELGEGPDEAGDA